MLVEGNSNGTIFTLPVSVFLCILIFPSSKKHVADLSKFECIYTLNSVEYIYIQIKKNLRHCFPDGGSSKIWKSLLHAF
jgi:hypothetical protein